MKLISLGHYTRHQTQGGGVWHGGQPLAQGGGGGCGMGASHWHKVGGGVWHGGQPLAQGGGGVAWGPATGTRWGVWHGGQPLAINKQTQPIL